MPLTINELWHSKKESDWNDALDHYWSFVQCRNHELEISLERLDLDRIQKFDADKWYQFLRDEYFRWKYTSPNRYKSTTIHLAKYVNNNALDELDDIRKALLKINVENIQDSLKTALRIKGLGPAGASGLLSLMYPRHFGTVDQFVVKSLQKLIDLEEHNALMNMNPENLTVNNGVLLISIMRQKAKEINQTFSTTTWTTRKIDKILWSSRY